MAGHSKFKNIMHRKGVKIKRQKNSQDLEEKYQWQLKSVEMIRRAISD